jgi:hypothetical protein
VRLDVTYNRFVQALSFRRHSAERSLVEILLDSRLISVASDCARLCEVVQIMCRCA